MAWISYLCDCMQLCTGKYASVGLTPQQTVKIQKKINMVLRTTGAQDHGPEDHWCWCRKLDFAQHHGPEHHGAGKSSP